MKKPTYIYKIVLFVLSALVSFQVIFAQDKEQEIKELVLSKDFAFKVDNVVPMSGNSRIITSYYDLQLIKDSIAVYLPYFGRAYSATFGNTEGGVRLNGSNFDYKIKERRKGGWEITIRPQDPEIREMNLTISREGYASLNVTSNNRQPISYNGRIIKRNTK